MKKNLIAIILTALVSSACAQIGQSVKVLEIPECAYVEITEVDGIEEQTTQVIDRDTFLMMAKCVEAEAGNQDMLGKRLVVDVILNRVDHEAWPDDIEGVIKQKNQFAVYPRAMERTVPSEETYQACWMELEHRTDTQIMYFASCGYIGKPAYKHGAHYFCY